MEIRKSSLDDVKDIMTLINQGKSYVIEDTKIIGTMYFAIEDEPTYHIIDGAWKTANQPYAVIHRIVVDEAYKGQNIAHQLLEYAIHECQHNHIHSIRIDTHKDNLSMQRFLTKHSFEVCGEITLLSGARRIGFEKICE